MQTTWILAADSSRVRIFEELDAEHHLREIEDFANSAGDAHERDLLTDAPDRRNFGKGGRGSIHNGQPAVSPIEHENELFSRDVSEFLNRAHDERRFDKLCVIAPPKFLGLLRQNLSKDAQKLVNEEIAKDISWFDEQEIEKFVRDLRH